MMYPLTKINLRMKKITVLIFSLLFAYAGMAQSIHGIIKDEKTQAGLPFANVLLLQDNERIGGTTTDLDGNYSFSNIEKGMYDVETVYVGYRNHQITGINVGETPIEVNVEIGVDHNSTPICGPLIMHVPPLIEHDDTSTGIKMKGDEIMRRAF